MELKEARRTHNQLVVRLKAFDKAGHGTPIERKALVSQIGHHGNAFNPRLSAKAAAFFK